MTIQSLDAFLEYDKCFSEKEIKDDLRNKQEIQQFIKDTLQANRILYYKIKNSPEIIIEQEYIDMLISAGEFRSISYTDLTTNAYNRQKGHMLNQPSKGVDFKVAGIAPLLQLEEVKKSWESVTEVTTAKTIGVLVSSIFTLFLGELTSLSFGVLMFAILHFLATILTSKFTSQNIWRNFIAFLLVFCWISISHILSFSGFLADGAQDIFFLAVLYVSDLQNSKA